MPVLTFVLSIVYNRLFIRDVVKEALANNCHRMYPPAMRSVIVPVRITSPEDLTFGTMGMAQRWAYGMIVNMNVHYKG